MGSWPAEAFYLESILVKFSRMTELPEDRYTEKGVYLSGESDHVIMEAEEVHDRLSERWRFREAGLSSKVPELMEWACKCLCPRELAYGPCPLLSWAKCLGRGEGGWGERG